MSFILDFVIFLEEGIGMSRTVFVLLLACALIILYFAVLLLVGHRCPLFRPYVSFAAGNGFWHGLDEEHGRQD